MLSNWTSIDRLSNRYKAMVISGAEPSSLSHLRNTKFEVVEINGKKYLTSKWEREKAQQGAVPEFLPKYLGRRQRAMPAHVFHFVAAQQRFELPTRRMPPRRHNLQSS